MSSDKGLISAYLLDRQGAGRKISWEEIATWQPEQGLLWVHLDYSVRQSKKWLKNDSGLDPLTVKALIADESRSRCVVDDNSIYLSLRGVNLNPGQDAEDMVSIRVWFDKDRIITTRRRVLLSVSDLRDAIDKNRGPKTSSEFLTMLNNRLVNRMADVIDSVDERVDMLEEKVATAESYLLRPKLSEVRRDAIALRRYLSPLRQALYQLQIENTPLFTKTDKMQIRESTDRLIRYIEDLDMSRDRSTIVQEELTSRLSEQVDSRMYLLSIVAAIFLPMTFITGLLGINVGGIPGGSHQWAFAIVCFIMFVILILTIAVLRYRHWM